MNNNQMLNQQEVMLHNIQQNQFYVLDLALYLDTHPNDPVALYRHKQYSMYLRQLIEAYEAQFGPLNVYSVERADTWRYINGPWPWDTRKDMAKEANRKER